MVSKGSLKIIKSIELTGDSRLVRVNYKTFDVDLKTGLIISPKNETTETPFYLVFYSTLDTSLYKHFEIQVDNTSSSFASLEINPKSSNSIVNWEYWNGSSWATIPALGLNSDTLGAKIRFYTALQRGTKYWRVRELLRN